MRHGLLVGFIAAALGSVALLVPAAHAEEVAPGPPQPPEPEPPPPQGARPEQAAPMAAGRATVGESVAVDTRRQGSDDIVGKRRELEISTAMVFVTSRSTMAGVPQLYFTDVGLWRTNVTYTPLPRVRLTGAVELLAKKPATIDESFWQSAAFGIQLNTSKRTALALSFELGSMLGDSGVHGSLGLGLQGRKRMNEFISWEGRLGGSATSLWYDANTAKPFWFAEAGGSGEVQFCWGPCKLRYGATWFAIDMGVPIAHGPEGIDVATGLSLDPRTHLGVTLGTFFNVSKKWDMYVTTAWVDRGDAEKPATQLPILDGGFDQVQLAVGIIAHWSFDRCGPDDRDPDCPDRDEE